ncbi:MAG: hypothetical protein QXV94_01230 [Thermoplasmata archaeon]
MIILVPIQLNPIIKSSMFGTIVKFKIIIITGIKNKAIIPNHLARSI